MILGIASQLCCDFMYLLIQRSINGLIKSDGATVVRGGAVRLKRAPSNDRG